MYPIFKKKLFIHIHSSLVLKMLGFFQSSKWFWWTTPVNSQSLSPTLPSTSLIKDFKGLKGYITLFKIYGI